MSLIWMYGSLRVARVLHKELIDAVLGTTLRYVMLHDVARYADIDRRWMDQTPLGRIISRLTNDIRACQCKQYFSISKILHVRQWMVPYP